MDRVELYEEFRLIERCESEINGAWKGAHILLFFLAFVFGTFCTFCFHMLMYLFDEKCVLFPKILPVNAIRNSYIYNFLPEVEITGSIPVDFVSTQWVEESACYLPTYLPLVSGLFGLVWTTMLLMCSTGSRTLSGLQRPWRILPPVFIFSAAMGCLCIYTSSVTHAGLQDLCNKLSEITGKPSCTYTINVVTLAYERRIRGVYQATRLTIISAWLHTSCWLLAAGLALLRIALFVDFRLVRIRAELLGNVEKMLEHHEKHIRTVSPDFGNIDKYTNTRFNIHPSQSSKDVERNYRLASLHSIKVDTIHYISQRSPPSSVLSLVPEERDKLARLSAYRNLPKNQRFIAKILYDMLDNINLSEDRSDTSVLSSISSSHSFKSDSSLNLLMRQYGQSHIQSTDEHNQSKTINKKKSIKPTKTENKRRLIPKKTTFRHTFSQTETLGSALQITETKEKPLKLASPETLKTLEDERTESSQSQNLQVQEKTAREYQTLDTLKEDLQPEDKHVEDLQPNNEQAEYLQPKHKQAKELQPEDEQGKDLQPKDEQAKELQPEDEQGKDLQSKDEQAKELQPEDEQGKDLQPKDEQATELQPNIDQAENIQQPEDELTPRDSTKTKKKPHKEKID